MIILPTNQHDGKVTCVWRCDLSRACRCIRQWLFTSAPAWDHYIPPSASTTRCRSAGVRTFAMTIMKMVTVKCLANKSRTWRRARKLSFFSCLHHAQSDAIISLPLRQPHDCDNHYSTFVHHIHSSPPIFPPLLLRPSQDQERTCQVKRGDSHSSPVTSCSSRGHPRVLLTGRENPSWLRFRAITAAAATTTTATTIRLHGVVNSRIMCRANALLLRKPTRTPSKNLTTFTTITQSYRMAPTICSSYNS
jgi:hypothetical protein